MSTRRNIAALIWGAVFLTGCASAELPDIRTGPVAGTDSKTWLAFLPIDQILGSDPADLALSQAQDRALLARAARLRARARLLKGPVVSLQERLRLLTALRRLQP